MSVSQVSVFLESRPGHMKRVLDSFVEAGISVRGFSASDTGDYGIVRFIVDDPKAALDVLQREGCAAIETQITVVRLDDVPGELARVMGVLATCGINFDYSYSLVSTYIALHTSDVEATEAALANQPVTLLSQSDLKHVEA